MDFKNIVCPVSAEKIDGNVSRLTIFLNVILMGLFLYTLNPVFIGIVAIDYFARAVAKPTSSLMRSVAASIVSAIKLKKKPINLAPKIFASRLGFLCAFSSFVLMLLGYPTSSVVIAAILMTLSTLDSVFNYCVGCLIYNFVVLPFYKDK